MVSNVAAVRAAIIEAQALAGEFQTAEMKLYEEGNATPILTTPCRVKKPKPSSFDAGNKTEWATKRMLMAKVPMDAATGIIRSGLIAQISTPDGDPTINHINFTVQSALTSQFAAEREISLVTEVQETPRIGA